MTHADRTAVLERELAELRRELDELRAELATEIRTRRIIVSDPDEPEHSRHEVEITRESVTVRETSDGAPVTALLCADNGIASVMVYADDDADEPAAQMQAINTACGFGHDSQARSAALVSIGDVELVNYVPGFGRGSYTMVDAHELAAAGA